MEALIKKRGYAKAVITRIGSWVDKNIATQTDKNQLEIRKRNLIAAYDKYQSIQEEIFGMDGSDAENSDELEIRYCDIYSSLETKIEKLAPSRATDNIIDAVNQTNKNLVTELMHGLSINSSPTQVKLPEIKIPIFAGNSEEWNSFIELFTNLILDNSNLNDVQKLVYLKGFLRGEPLNLIQNLTVIGSNLTIALNLLKNRYANINATINSHINNLLNLSELVRSGSGNLREFLTIINQNIESLKNLNVPVQHWDLILINIICKKLDYNTNKAYCIQKNSHELPTLGGLLEFLEKQCRILEEMETNTSNLKPRKKSAVHLASANSSDPKRTEINSTLKCIYCSRGHTIYKCPEFKLLSTNQRICFIEKKNLCAKCLLSTHPIKVCKSRNCFNCGGAHNSLLHIRYNNQGNSTENWRHRTVQSSNQDTKSDEVHGGTSSNQGSLSLSTTSTNGRVLLATAIVAIVGHNGKLINARCLLDCGSQSSLCTRELVAKLDLNPIRHELDISGISQTKTYSNKSVKLKIRPHSSSATPILVSCAVLDHITCDLPQQSFDIRNFKLPQNIQLADPEFHIPSKVDLLIGADIYYDLIMPGIIKLGKNLPTLINTIFGYVVGGNYIEESLVSDQIQNRNCVNHSVSLISVTNQNSDDIIKKFWEIEEVDKEISIDQNSDRAEQIFQETTIRLKNGQFQVDLPFKESMNYRSLGDSFYKAKNRFLSLEKKLTKNSKLKESYTEFINEYISLNHARIVPLSLTNECDEKKYFMPHHAVIRENSESTKLRVVFDASMKTNTGWSLNDLLLKGNIVQPDLYDILSRFRLFKYVAIADIQKMFRQIRINPKHNFLQNILWRNNPNEEIKCIELTTVTYGTTSAPFVATRCLKELANIGKNKYPLASNILLSQTYVDDILIGTDTLEELYRTCQQIIELLNSAGFQLHKWHSNSPEFIKVLFSNNNVHSNYKIKSEISSNKVLGLEWKIDEDAFVISVPDRQSASARVTKRELLSSIASIFDPLGLLGPITALAKCIMQKTWLQKIDWDECLNYKLEYDWRKFVKQLHTLSELKIPRNVFHSMNYNRIEIHVFSDASVKLYGTCLYVRTIDDKNITVSCNLMTSKSRVTPLKAVTLPRLELCGAVLAAKLTERMLKVLPKTIEIASVNLWTDSEIVLYWIASPASRWTTFVSNRVALIQKATSSFNWRHIASEENPADIISRGITAEKLKNCDMWWHGPQFLRQHDLNLSKYDFKHKSQRLNNDLLKSEQKKSVVSLHVNKLNIFWNLLFDKFSSFSRLQRTIAYCYRFIDNCKALEKRPGSLTIDELTKAKINILKAVQFNSFSREILDLKANKPLKNKQFLYLNPFLDKDDLIRVGGRIRQADIPYDHKFPILLPAKDKITKLLLKKEHINLYHAGPQTVLSNIRLKYWPLNGLNEIKKIIHDCMTCYRVNPKPAQQLMSDLPKIRVTMERPFFATGVDYGGPLIIKSSALRNSKNIKCYFAVFVCMATKAIHIELVSDLTREAFLAALKRFIARRGNPAIIYSDNATNFQGAKNNIKELYDFLKTPKNKTEIIEFLSEREIQWRFIPPLSPHWGGIWEAAIKSVKYHIKRVVGNTNLTFEKLYTFLTQIESILNSRPLCPMSTDPTEYDVLTPGHFLIGTSLSALPEGDIVNMPINRLSQWQHYTQLKQHFWKRWSREYLNQLQNRPKWLRPYENIKVDELVLLKEDNVPPLKWPRARIVEVIPGKDGKIRAAKLKTQNGEFVRSIAKICPLPCN